MSSEINESSLPEPRPAFFISALTLGAIALWFGTTQSWLLVAAFVAGMAVAGLIVAVVAYIAVRHGRAAGADRASSRMRAVDAVDKSGMAIMAAGTLVGMVAMMLLVTGARAASGQAPTGAHFVWILLGLGISAAGALISDTRAFAHLRPGLFGLPVQRTLRDLTR